VGAPHLRSFSEAASLLTLPAAREALSPLTGEGILLVDLSLGDSPVDDAGFARALATLPAPSVALARRDSPLSQRFDVHVATEDELQRIAERVARNPLASLALVELLRRSERRPVHESLLDESLVYSMLQSGPEFASWLADHRQRPPRPTTARAAVRVERYADTLELTLDRPEKRNAFSAEMRDALCEALEVAVGDDSIRRILLRGEGGAFCSGGDLDEFGSLPDPATAHAIRSTRHAGRLLADCAERAEARIHGACVGAGIELPAFCHRVIAEADAVVRLPEVAMGLVPGAGGTCSIPRRIGRQQTARLALSGETLDADAALALGLVDEVRG
jgi:enoyl-CoA hydratase/carnithine racemase